MIRKRCTGVEFTSLGVHGKLCWKRVSIIPEIPDREDIGNFWNVQKIRGAFACVDGSA